MYDSLFYHASWLQVFLPFQFSFFQVKMVNYYEGYENFQDTEYQLQENTLHHYPHCRFLSTQLKSSTDNFCSISLPYCLFISQYLIYDDSVFIKNFHVFVARTYQYQLIDLILLWSFLRMLAMLILMQKDNVHVQAHIFQEKYFESC